MNRTQRVIWSDAGVLKDISKVVNDYGADTQTIPLVAADDAIYIGTELPFNHKHFEVGTVNATTSAMSIAIWTGQDWKSVVDLIDETEATAGKSLSGSGQVSFSPNIDDLGWQVERVSGDVTGLSGTKIYNLYWARLTFSADLTAGFTLRYVGERFANDTEMFKRYPDLSQTTLMAAFKTGKTDWNDQHLVAGEEIVRDLRRRNIVIRREQVLRAELLGDAGVHKAAELIYAGLGTSYAERRKAAAADYAACSNIQFFEVDQTADAVSDSQEKVHSTRFLSR